MANCEHERKAHAYHDGELPPEERREFEAHLARCPSCAQGLEALRRLSRFLASARVPDLSAEALDRLHRGRAIVLEPALLRTSEFFALAAAAVLLACSIWLWRADGSTEVGEGSASSWESVAVTLQPAANDPESRTSQWIVANLAGGDAHD